MTILAQVQSLEATLATAQTSVAAILAALAPPADGSGGAPAGAPQYPALLAGYKARQPAWNVAGVDYHVGIPDGQALTDWRAINDPTVGVDLSTGLIWPNANTECVFQNIDFSLGIGGAIYNAQGRASKITLLNCNINAPSTGNQSFPLLDQNMADVLIQNCKFDGSGASGGWNSFIAANGNITLLYNWFINSPSQILQWNPAASSKTVTAKYNLYDNMRLSTGAHRNYLEINANNVTIGYDVEYNTTYQDQSCGGQGGEGFQIYSNGTGVVLTNPVISCNTMIAKPGIGSAPLGMPTMSALIHGCGGGTTISGTGQNNNNYFDVSGAFGAYYAGTMTVSLGWASSGNVDMNSGAAIAPA